MSVKATSEKIQSAISSYEYLHHCFQTPTFHSVQSKTQHSRIPTKTGPAALSNFIILVVLNFQSFCWRVNVVSNQYVVVWMLPKVHLGFFREWQDGLMCHRCPVTELSESEAGNVYIRLKISKPCCRFPISSEASSSEWRSLKIYLESPEYLFLFSYRFFLIELNEV